MEKFASRFFNITDAKARKFIFDLPRAWWSRPYEYAWASEFVEPDDVALDAACGICHPFKFYLLDHCREVHACDIDERILSPKEILKDIANDFGEKASREFPEKYLKGILYEKAPLDFMSYKAGTFDKIYCISVLEHLKDAFNKKSRLADVPIINRFLPRNIHTSLKEFKRVLKDDGLIILTMDYPVIDLGYLQRTISEVGLELAGEVYLHPQENALYSKNLNLYCWRAVLKKKGGLP